MKSDVDISQVVWAAGHCGSGRTCPAGLVQGQQVRGTHHLQSSSLHVPVRSKRQKHFLASIVLLWVTELRDIFSFVLK